MSDPPLPQPLPPSANAWFWRGAGTAFSLPGLILCSAFVGFAGLAREAGLSIDQAVFMVGVVWALPAKVVLIGAIMAGSSLPATAFAVTLSSVRLTPMVVSLVPEIRVSSTRRWVLYALSHFVAVTSWVLAMSKLRNVPREVRTAWYCGLGGTLIVVNMIVVAITYLVAAQLPPVASAALLLLTPIYFLTSMWGSAREPASHVAMVLGLALGPAAHLLVPGFDLLATGLAGGVLAFLYHLWAKRRNA